jgi:hypothetical protein
MNEHILWFLPVTPLVEIDLQVLRTLRRVMETTPLYPAHLVDRDSISGYGPMASTNRHVRTRMRGGEGRDGERPSLTQLSGISLTTFFPRLTRRYAHQFFAYSSKEEILNTTLNVSEIFSKSEPDGPTTFPSL